ncbi:MAG: nitroreductase family protein [Actinomycetota bacterium]|nr:nitroreductase family protein [Actinomycetota bacterium]MDA2949233.1 nitroreductase family protein [Actinomycetota bacterium]
MSADFPDAEAMRAVLTLATRAPSVHNSQPWYWRVGPSTLNLYADSSRHLPRTDPDRRDMLLSCGAGLHHCTVALAAIGWRAKIHRLPDPSEPGHLAAVEVVAQSPGELDVTLAAAIARRRTDRRTYSSWPVPWGDIALMGARAARAGVMLRQTDLLPRLGDGTAQDNGVVVALGTEADDDLARLRAGEATSLVLLSATAMGLATCPMTDPLEIPETRAAVRDDVFGTSGHPQMLMRVGWTAVDADPLPSTPRRPLPEVANWLLDGAFVGDDAASRTG